MLNRKKYALFLVLAFLIKTTFSQVKDKNWLLLDSVNYNSITGLNKIILDSLLPIYHKAKSDTAKISLLLGIAENLEDEALWPRYNRLAYEAACKGGNETTYLKHKASALNNMGFFSHNNGNIPAAINYYSEALTIREKTKDQHGIANSLNNLGALFYLKMDLKQSVIYYEKSLKIAKELNYKRGIAYAYNNLGNVYRAEKNYKKALEFQSLGLNIRKEIGDGAGLSGTYYNFSAIYQEMKDLKKAETYGLKALQVAKDGNHAEKTREAAEILFEIYKEGKHFEKALQMFEMYISMRDSTNTAEARKSSLKQQFKYEYEKKEANLKAEQEKKDVIAAEESRRQKLFLALVIAIALAVGVVALIVIRSLRITKKQKRIIERQKHIVEEKQKEILDSIHYAKRIQKALLPSEKYIERNLNNR